MTQHALYAYDSSGNCFIIPKIWRSVKTNIVKDLFLLMKTASKRELILQKSMPKANRINHMREISSYI